MLCRMFRMPRFRLPRDPLARMFWTDLVLPRAVILACLAGITWWLWLPMIPALAMLAADVVFFLWQIRRFQRASDDHVRGLGGLAPVWGGYLAILFLGLLTASLWWGLLLSRPGDAPGELFTDRMDREHAAQYDLVPSPDGTILRLNGTITFGLTRRAGELVETMPRLRTVVLTSHGGHIYEARGFAGVIRARSLATRAEGECSSACTLVFIAGAQRSLAPDARLGFHQYALEFDDGVLNVDPRKEQEKDIRFFRQQGVSETFLTRIFERPSSELWYPTLEDLRAGGVLTGE